MKFVKIILVSIVVLSFVGVVFGEEGGDEISVDFLTSFLSRYVSSAGAVYHDDAVVQSDLHIDLSKGFYADIWHSWSPDHGHLTDDYGDELDYIFGWKGEIEDNLQMDIGAGYLDNLDLMKGCGGDFVMFYAELRQIEAIPFVNLEISPFLRSEIHIDLSNDSGDGIYLMAGIDSSLEVYENLSIAQRLAMIYDSGAYHFGAGFVGNYGIDLNWQVSEEISITPVSFKFYLPDGSADGKGTQTIFGGGVAIKF